MIKSMNGYKVITKNGRLSARASNWEWDNLKRYSLHYPINQIVTPKVKGSKIMFFKNLIDAETFHDPDDDIIVPCIAYNVIKMKYTVSIVPCIDQFWNNYIHRKSVQTVACKAIKGTYGADSIICLE